tara:strand:+ start:241 stop:495 length:255 start_codon:yes stop_codon:yes gene_type:complete
MSRPMINETLENTENYNALRSKMLKELVDDELDSPIEYLMGLLEDHTFRMFEEFDDDTMQDMYDTLMESKNEIDEEAKAQEEDE